MPILTIREDEYSLYLKTNGSIYRPVKTQYSVIKITTNSSFFKGDKVKGGMISQSPDCRVGFEIWTSHGEYTYDNGKHKSSTECWDVGVYGQIVI